MKRLFLLLLLAVLPLTFGCYIIFVEHPRSGAVGSNIEIEMLLAADPDGAGAVTPQACIGLPESWSVTGAQYSALVDGSITVSGTGTLDTDAGDAAQSEFPFTTNGELVAWNCYAGAYTDYGTQTFGTVTFQVQVGSAGVFTLHYAASSADQDIDYSVAERPFATDGSLDDLNFWRNSNYGPAADWTNMSVAYGDGMYVAAAASRLNTTDYQVLTSTNGMDWAETPVPPAFVPEAVTYGADGFVMVGDSGQLALSADGMSWAVTTAGSVTYNDAVYGNGVYIAVGDDSTAAISSDGLSWSTGLMSGDVATVSAVEYANGTFCAVGMVGSDSYAYYSTSNAVNWGGSTISTLSEPLFDMTYGNGYFVAVGRQGNIYRSPTCQGGWNNVPSGTTDHLFSVDYADGHFVAAGGQGTLLTSPDGFNWTLRKPGVFGNLNGITEAGGGFVTVGGYGVILLSSGVDLGGTGSGGGGGGGCNTAGPVPGEPVWPEILWIALLAVILKLHRRRLSRT